MRTALTGQQAQVSAINIGEALQFSQRGAAFRNLGVMSAVWSPLAPEATEAYALLRDLPPGRYEAELRDAEAQFQQLWNEVLWDGK